MLCRHLSAHKLSATEEQPSQRERGTEHCVREREGGRRRPKWTGYREEEQERNRCEVKEKRREEVMLRGKWKEETKEVNERMDGSIN